MKDKLLKFFEEIEWIEDESLKEKVLACWEEAIKRSDFTLDELPHIPFTLLIEDAPFSLITHTKAVTRTAIAIAKAMGEIYGNRFDINMDYLIAGGILHDVAKVLEYEKKEGKIVKSHFGKRLRHPMAGAALAYSLGLPYEVVHIIASHSKEGDFTERSTESIIIHHADFVNFEPFK